MSIKRFFIYLPLLSLGILFSALTLHCGADSSTTPNLGLSTQGCGSGTIDAGESCDDGNTENSDGCNAHCAWEVGVAVCGNGVLENDECCDDGNTNNGDGCSDTCLSERNNHPPLAPLLAANPSNGITWAPTRLYLSWSASTDSDPGDRVVYDVYFAEGPSEGNVPYKKDIRTTHFIIQASTDNRSEYFPDLVRPIYLTPNTTYTWKVCARDSKNASNCSERRVFNTDNSVVGWWRFDENPGGPTCPSMPEVGGPAGDPGETVCDYSGFGNHGRPNGSPSWLAPLSGLMENSLGGSLQFDGIDDWIEIADNTSLNPRTQISIESKQMLGEFGGVGRDRRIVSKILPTSGDTTGYLFGFGFGSDIGLAIGTDSGGLTLSPFITGNWYHLLGTFDGTAIRIFLNGTTITNFPLTRSISPNTHFLEIGHTTRFNSFYLGRISEVLIYSKALNDFESQNSYLCQ